MLARHNARTLSSVANTTTRSRAFCPLSWRKNGFGSSPPVVVHGPTKLRCRRVAGSGGTIPCLKRRMPRLAVCILSRSFAASDAFNNAPASSRAGWTSPTTALSFSVALMVDTSMAATSGLWLCATNDRGLAYCNTHKNNLRALNYEKQ